MMTREQMRADVCLKERHRNLIDAISRAAGIAAVMETPHGMGATSRMLRGARIAVEHGQSRWRKALQQTLAGIWKGENAEGKRKATRKRVEEAIREVQRWAGLMLVRWREMGKKARRWAARRRGLPRAAASYP